jgi:hypothetical protein
MPSSRVVARLKEYGFLLLAGLIGGAFGIANDVVTATMSPEYFSLGKGLAEGDGFYLRVAWLAFKAGCAAGAGAAAVALYANNPKPGRPSLPYPRMFLEVWKPLGCALLFGVGLGTAAHLLSLPPVMFRRLVADLHVARAHVFITVWYVHLGLYLGLAVGVVWVVISIRRARHQLALAQNTPGRDATKENRSPA